MATPQIIGLTGLTRSGKDTVGTILAEHHGFTRVAIADGIREAALALDPLIKTTDWTRTVNRSVEHPTLRQRIALFIDNRRPGDKVVIDEKTIESVRLSQVVAQHGWDEAETISEVRRTLQRIGTEAGSQIHGQKLWLDLAAKKINGPTVITDIRFTQEAAWLDSVDGKLWLIEHPDNTLALTGEPARHLSEARNVGGQPDATIINDGTLDDLVHRVAALLETT